MNEAQLKRLERITLYLAFASALAIGFYASETLRAIK